MAYNIKIEAEAVTSLVGCLTGMQALVQSTIQRKTGLEHKPEVPHWGGGNTITSRPSEVTKQVQSPLLLRETLSERQYKYSIRWTNVNVFTNSVNKI